MFLIDNNGVTDPTVNLALEEYCYRNLDTRHDYVLFYINQPSIIIGNHQNPFQEVNFEFAARNKIRPVRRISGGGTVYHDPGNLNFSFITAFTGDMLDYFKSLLQPVLKSLQHLGVAAQLTEKNNIIVDGKKISGNSQHTDMRRMLSHGTLLFDARLDVLHQVLESKLEIIHSRAIASIRSSVTNVSNHLGRSMNMTNFQANLTAEISDALGRLEEYRLTGGDWAAVYRLAEEKYRSWDWTFGRTPEFSVIHRFKFSAGDVWAQILVKRGIIEDIQFSAHNNGSPDIRSFMDSLIGKRYDSEVTDQLLW
ncbi:MAG: lipoate--protein ligase [Desulfobacterales bacterium]|nr:MAG: lipoate--protein ligase [Desulfobacterales bacterium]